MFRALTLTDWRLRRQEQASDVRSASVARLPRVAPHTKSPQVCLGDFGARVTVSESAPPPGNSSALVCEPQRGEKSPGQPLSEAAGEQSKNRCGNSAGHIFNRVRKLLLWHLCHRFSCHRRGVKGTSAAV